MSFVWDRKHMCEQNQQMMRKAARMHLETEEDEPEASRWTLAVPIHELMYKAADYKARHHAQSAQLHIKREAHMLKSK